jgi:Fic family protein
MEELHDRFVAAREAGDHHPLLLIGCYVFDFLAIHPFRDGNGRIGRLLTLLLLYQSGYGVGRYISIERLTRDSGQGYYDALEAAGHGWHEAEHTVWPWLDYLLGDPDRRLPRVRGAGEPAGRRPRREDGGDRAVRPFARER